MSTRETREKPPPLPRTDSSRFIDLSRGFIFEKGRKGALVFDLRRRPAVAHLPHCSRKTRHLHGRLLADRLTQIPRGKKSMFAETEIDDTRARGVRGCMRARPRYRG